MPVTSPSGTVAAGFKRKLREIDFKRDKAGVPTNVVSMSTIPTALPALR
jgi:hypothetical protein